MVTRLPFVIDVPGEIFTLATLFKHAGFELYLVGGAVRDALMGIKPKDFDVATNATPDKVVGILNNIGGVNVLEVGQAFGVVRAIFPSGFVCEIATFRYDVGVGRRPESVVFSTIEEDVKRRDLTINALFYDINNREVVDFVGGIDDINNGVVRTVGRPIDRFNEDRLRILRAVRFAAHLGCELDAQAESAIICDNALSGVSPERIRDEFLKSIKNAKSVTHLFALMERLELFQYVFPTLEVSTYEVREIRDHVVLLALVLNKNPSKDVATAMNRMKYTVEEVRQVLFLRDFTWFCWNDELGDEESFNVRSQPLLMYRSFKTSGLTTQQLRTYSRFKKLPRQSVVDAFLSYKPTTDGNVLLAQGFKGKALGVELERRERLRFIELLNGNSAGAAR